MSSLLEIGARLSRVSTNMLIEELKKRGLSVIPNPDGNSWFDVYVGVVEVDQSEYENVDRDTAQPTRKILCAATTKAEAERKMWDTLVNDDAIWSDDVISHETIRMSLDTRIVAAEGSARSERERGYQK